MIKKSILLLIVLPVVACSTAATRSENAGLTFIHLNDIYRVDAVEDGTAGGMSRVATIVRELQAEGRDVRILFGGDFLYPSLESQLWDGLQMVDAMNFLDALAPMYVVAGNHEFDPRGSEQLVAAVHASEFEWLADNYTFATGDQVADERPRRGFVMAHDDMTIGFFALTLHADDGGNVRDYIDIDKDYVGAAKRAILALEARDVDLIVGLTHLHMRDDIELARLRDEHPTFRFIVGGHDHEPQFSRLPRSAVVMKGASNARFVWQVDVDRDVDGEIRVETRRIVVDESIAFDPGYDVLATKWRGRLLEKFPFLEARIGRAALPMDAREEQIRSGETSWGNFVVDQMRTAFGEPAADLAFINSGTLRLDDVVSGDIRFEDIGRTFGFSSYLRYMTLTGAEFEDVMEAGYRGGPESQGYFPQVSGFRVCVDRSRAEYDRIVSLEVPTAEGWAEIEPARDYTVVVSDFLYRGGDGYDIPKDRFASRPGSELKYLVLDAVLRAQALGQAVGEPVTDDNRRQHLLHGPKERCFGR